MVSSTKLDYKGLRVQYMTEIVSCVTDMAVEELQKIRAFRELLGKVSNPRSNTSTRTIAGLKFLWVGQNSNFFVIHGKAKPSANLQKWRACLYPRPYSYHATPTCVLQGQLTDTNIQRIQRRKRSAWSS